MALLAQAILQYLSVRDRRFVDRSPIFFGWFVVVAATIGMAMTIPGQTAGLALFIDSFIAELGISRATISLTYTIATVAGALALPFVGRQIDRFGPRRAVVVIAALFGLACFYMGGMTIGLLTLAAGFVLMRGLGQGALSLVSVHAVNLWFVRHRGRAVGIMGIGIALSTAFFPLLVERLIASFGWRDAFFILGAGILAVMVPVGLVLYRPHPEQFGLRPDGDAPIAEGEAPAEEVVATLAEARRMPIFWVVTAGGMTMAALGTGLIFHHFSILAQNGLDRAAAAFMFVPLGMMTATANLGTGFLLDRTRPRIVLGVMMTAFSVLLLTVPFVASVPAVWTYGAIFGLLQGSISTINGSAYGHYFGRRHLGAIKGFANTMFVAGSAAGPLIYGMGFSALGGYDLVISLTAIIPITVALTAFRTR